MILATIVTFVTNYSLRKGPYYYFCDVPLIQSFVTSVIFGANHFSCDLNPPVFSFKHNTFSNSHRRHVKLDKNIFGTSWPPDLLLCKHWFASSLWNFCPWVADVPPRKTSPAAKSEEKRMFSQANPVEVVLLGKFNAIQRHKRWRHYFYQPDIHM